MEQKDYILREISKIGQIINAIRQLLFGGSDLLAITLESQIKELPQRKSVKHLI